MEAVMPKRKQASPSLAAKTPSATKAKPLKAKPLKRARARLNESLRITHPHAAGIDVHATVHVVCVPAQDAPPPPKNQPPNVPANVRHFGACTADLEMLADWLQACGVTTVAMESTGVYWVPLFELLERRGFEV